MKASIGRPLAAFLALGLALSWYPWALKLAGSAGDGGPNPLGLLLAALILTAVMGGWPATRAFLGRIVRLRAGWRAWVLAVAAAPVALALALAAGLLAGIEVAVPALRWQDLGERFVFILLFVGLGEEPAWRGYLQPLLQERFSPLAAALIVGVVWGSWHLPLMGGEFAWRDVPAFLLSVLAAAIVLAAIWNLSGSVLPAMVLHTLVNVLAPPFMRSVPAEQLAHFWWIYSSAWCVLAAGVALIWRPIMLSRPLQYHAGP
jgi:membrane protease YdiL (CAAX protease family)